MSGSSRDDEQRDSRREGRFDELVGEAIEVELETGRRESTVEKAKRNLIVRIAIIVAGTFLVLLGFVFIVIPGPGLITIAAGLALLAIDVPFARRWLDKVQARLPAGDDGKVKPWVIIVSIGATIVFTAASLWFTFGRS
ncbi:MAG: PGPGW domain-containing protein [Actinobacteria bacterium]|nr:PGPGW domain-containing protein [Actinomycetota bacterium]